MAGNETPSGFGGADPPKPSGPKVKTFTCPNCGGTVEIRCPGQTLSVVCSSCKSIIDANDPNYKVLAASSNRSFFPRIELGTRGKLHGETWEVIGFMVRADVSSGYSWEEYLLFNPRQGFRWLTQAGGHWNFITPIKEKPTVSGNPYDMKLSGGERAEYKDRSFRLYYRGDAEVWYVLGEFYWRVFVGNRCKMSDYICPPQMLSVEKDDNEVNWSVSDYMSPAEITAAFPGVKHNKVYTIGPNQPSANTARWNEVKFLWGIFFIVLVIIQLSHVVGSHNITVYSNGYSFLSNAKKPDITTSVFSVANGPGNLRIGFTGDVDNSWLYLAGDLVNDDTGQTYSFERTCEYYHGFDGGEAWSEGSRDTDILISNVPDGKYYINLDTESGDFKEMSTERAFSVAVTRGVPTWSNFWWFIFIVSIIPGCMWLASRADETARWRESDYNPYLSKSSS